MEATLPPLGYGLPAVDRRLPSNFQPANELLEELHVDVIILDNQDVDGRDGGVDVRG